MTKVMKRLIIAACICIVLGIIIMAGAIAGGGANEMKNAMENGGIGWDESGFHVGATVVGNNEGADSDLTDGKEFSFAADEIEDLEIELEAGTFEIIEADTDQIVVRSSKEVKVSQSGDKLSVKTSNRFIVFGAWKGDAQKVEITLPKGQEFHTIDIEIGAGELDVESLAAKNITLELGAGRIEVENYLCESADISVGAGEIIVDNGTAENMDLDVGMGDFQFKGNISGDLDADCGMGSMDITLSGKETDYNYQIDCGMGDVSIGNTSYGGMASSKVIDNNASADFDLDCGMGSINIYFED